MKRQIVTLMAVILLSAANAWAVVHFAVTDLGTLPSYSTRSIAWGISNSGQIVGEVTGSNTHAFLWQSGTGMLDLGSLGGSSHAASVNDSGQVVGYSNTGTGQAHAFLYSNGVLTDLNPLLGSIYGSNACGINASEQIVGFATVLDGPVLRDHAFLYSNETMTDLTPAGYEYSYAHAINYSGQVVINAFNSGGPSHAFLYSKGTMTDLGTLPGLTDSYPSAINDNGQVVGWSYPGTGDGHAFLYSDGKMTDLGTLPGFQFSYANGVNSSQQVVGVALTAGRYGRPFIYSNGTISDLNDLIDYSSGWTLEAAEAINDSGWIVGVGTHDGDRHAFLLTPVPEPSTLALLGTGVIGLLGWAWRKRK